MGAHKAATGPDSMQRVKVYRLNDDGKWDDQGTGHVTLDYLERTEDVGLVVLDEEDSDPLLMHRICTDDIYRKQEDTIISWRDPEYATELALSFQESAGCTFIWNRITTVQRNLQFTAPNDKTSNYRSGLKELPDVELSTLPQLLKIITECGRADQMRLTELLVNNQEFFKKLMDLFGNCEDLDNKDALHMIYKIVKGIILLNSSEIFENIFGDDLLMDIIGSLEYDPDFKTAQRHRDFLNDHVVFREAIPINDPVVLSKIHQTYKIGYVKDIVMPKVLDEATISNLSSIIHSNNAIVISLLKDDNAFIQELFAKLKSSTTSAESKRNLVFFLYEFCSLSKSLQGIQQNRLFRDLANEGIFDAVTTALRSEDKRLVLKGTDILMLFLSQDPNLFRNFVIHQEGNLLLGLLVNGLLTDFGEDMNCQFFEIIRCFLDTDALPATQKDTVVEIFYDKYLSQLVDVIKSACPSGGSKPDILSNICELLCYCVVHHPNRIKCNFLLNNWVEGVLFLTQREEKYLVVGAVRFVRAILSHHDEHLMYHFVNNNILKPVVDAFVANGNRYNLLNSAVLDLFEYIRKENLQLFVRYIVESFWNQLVRFENLACIRSFKAKYDEMIEDFDARTNSNIINSQNHNDECTLANDEEKNSSGNSDDCVLRTASNSNKEIAQISLVNGGGFVSHHPLSSSKSASLVDYDDDDDDGDYLPPPNKHSNASGNDGGVVESHKKKRKSLHTDKNFELMKKQHCEDLKSDDIVTVPLCPTISQELLSEEKLDPAIAVLCSSDGNVGSDDKKQRDEESGSDNSLLDKKSAGSRSSYSENEMGNSTCPDQFDNHNSQSNEHPDDKEHKEPACQECSSNIQMYVGSDQEHIAQDPLVLISKESFAEEARGREVLSEGCYLDDKSLCMRNTQGTELNNQKGCLIDRNLAEENNKESDPSSDEKLDAEGCPVISQKSSPEPSTSGY